MKLAWLSLLAVATSASAQLGPCATPLGPDLPDLIVDRHTLRADKSVTEEFVETNSCQLIEGCVTAAGQRRLLRFTTVTANVGATALVIGDPSQCDLLFHLSECHGHYHFEQFADYRLWTRAGFRIWHRKRKRDEPSSSAHNAGLLQSLRDSGDLIAGRKQGFCLVDNIPASATTPAVFNNCATNQGISAGWSDVYRSDIDCQFVDVTGASPGRYRMEVEVNPDWVLPESNYHNNSVHTNIRVPKQSP